jgi:4-amino-4-deoxy-L-arabinose transferase-like glycosyltransferase
MHDPMSTRFRHFVSYEGFLLTSLVLVTLFLSTYHLSIHPRTWYDEGYLMQFPKNLVLHGQYGIRSSEGFRPFGGDTTGPTVLLPIAAAFQLFGIGLLQARSVMALYTMLAIAAFYFLSLRLFNKRTAIVATFLLVAMPWPGIFTVGRQVRGDVPAFFLLLVGTLLWWKSLASARVWVSLASGLAFGLAVVTKPQMMLLWVALSVTWMANALYYRKAKGWLFAVPLIASMGCFALWQLIRLTALGVDGFWAQWAANKSTLGVTLAVFSTKRIVGNLSILAQAGYVTWGVPALLFALIVALKERTQRGIIQFFQVALVAIWLGWWVLLSVGWSQYAFPACAWTALFIAQVFRELTHGFSLGRKKMGETAVTESREHKRLAGLCLLLVLAWMIAYPLPQLVREYRSAGDETPQEFANYLIAHVDESAVIESCEEEVSFLTNHNYHHQTTEMGLVWVNKVAFGVVYPPGSYDFLQYEPAYVVDGPFSKTAGLYSESLLRRSYTLVKSVGDYDLYKLVTNAADDNGGGF